MTKTATKPKTIGKNAPAKIEFFQKKKTVPSIPAKSFAPPEDKLAAQSDVPIQIKVKPPPLPSYLTEFESIKNPIVSPFSYSPRIISKNSSNAIGWENTQPRFKSDDSDTKSTKSKSS